jgi:hypothetical protein
MKGRKNLPGIEILPECTWCLVFSEIDGRRGTSSGRLGLQFCGESRPENLKPGLAPRPRRDSHPQPMVFSHCSATELRSTSEPHCRKNWVDRWVPPPLRPPSQGGMLLLHHDQQKTMCRSCCAGLVLGSRCSLFGSNGKLALRAGLAPATALVRSPACKLLHLRSKNGASPTNRT